MTRPTDLLRAAADALEDGRSPLEHAFLAEHGVTLDECMDLAGHLAMGARLLAYAVEHPTETAAAVNGANLIYAYEQLNAGLVAHNALRAARAVR